MRIGVSGPPGSGKTTLAKKLAKELNYVYVSGGDVFRREAEKRKMSIEEFSVYVENNPEIDLELDKYLLEEAKRTRVVIDSRLSCWLMKKSNIRAFKVYVDASVEERAKRIQKRDGGTFEDILRKIREREESERKRYLRLYGADYRDPSIYDFTIYTDQMSEDIVFSTVLEEFTRWLKNFW